MNEPGRASLLCSDQRGRWSRGDPVPVEAYVAQNPALRDDADGLLDLIYNEIILREQNGDAPRLEEYLQRFPEFADQLRVQFDVHEALEGPPLTEIDSGAARRPGRLAAETPPAFTTLPGYEILGELGRGGMGVVYRARQVELKREVALKMILSGPHAGPDERARFQAEAEAVARLQHPNIVQIYDIGQHNGLPYFSLELVQGPSLAQMAAGKPQPPDHAARLVETVARAAHHAHQQGIVHRDLKPANVLLSRKSEVSRNSEFGIRNSEFGIPKEDGGVGFHSEFRIPNSALESLSDFEPKVTDFGLAKLVTTETGQSDSGGFIGTPAYMAPEQAAGNSKRIGPAADVYALGAILYELLTGRPPFQGNSSLGILDQVRLREPVPPGRLRQRLPRELEAICLKCLQKDARRRYVSALDLADDLHRFLAGEPVRARPAAVWERVFKWAKRRPAVAALMAVVAAVLPGLLFIQHWHAGRVHRARDHYQQFAHRRDEALFFGIYGAAFADAEAPTSLAAAAAAAREALALVGIDREGRGGLVFDAYWSDQEKAQAGMDAYQLLLVLADVVASGLPEQTQADHDGQVRRALDLLDVAAGLGPATPAVHMRRARYLTGLGDAGGARRERERAAALRPAALLDYFLRGEERYRQNDMPGAISDFAMAVGLQPDDFWSHFFLAVCYLKAGDPTQAEISLGHCLTRRPRFIWTYLLRSLAYQQRQAFEAAEADYDAALELGASENAAYILHVNRGRMRLRRKRVEEAVADFKAAVALKPDYVDGHIDLARAYRKQNRSPACTEELEAAHRLRPPPLLQAECFFLGQRYADAVTACDAALRSAPDLAAGHYLRAQALLELKRYAAAAEAFDGFLAREGRAGPDFYRGRGRARMQLGHYLAARDDYAHGLELEPEAADLYRDRGWAYFFADAFKPALHDFNEAIRRDADSADGYAGRGLARTMLGHDLAAVDDAEEALRRGPVTAETAHNTACIFALALARLEREPADSDRQRQAGHYRARALETVRKALELVPPGERLEFWRDKILPDSALDSIRRTTEFKKLRDLVAGPRRAG